MLWSTAVKHNLLLAIKSLKHVVIISVEILLDKNMNMQDESVFSSFGRRGL